MKNDLLNKIDLFIAENFSGSEVKKHFADKISSCCYYLKISPPKAKKELDKRLAKIKKTFCEYLLAYIAERGLNEVEIYKKANLDRRIFSKIRNAENYMPRKRTILAIALAMELNIDEVEEILHEGGFALSFTKKEDVIIRYFIENRIYDMFLINEVLDHYGFKPFN